MDWRLWIAFGAFWLAGVVCGWALTKRWPKERCRALLFEEANDRFSHHACSLERGHRGPHYADARWWPP